MSRELSVVIVAILAIIFWTIYQCTPNKTSIMCTRRRPDKLYGSNLSQEYTPTCGGVPIRTNPISMSNQRAMKQDSMHRNDVSKDRGPIVSSIVVNKRKDMASVYPVGEVPGVTATSQLQVGTN
jgi:hypothetical protein